MNQRLSLSIAFTLGFFSAFAAFALSHSFSQSFFLQGNHYDAQSVTPVFSPGAEEQIVAFANSAQETLDVMLYQFSNPVLKEALAYAAGKGVVVRVILEPRVESNYATAEFLSQNGVRVKWGSKEYTNTHSKTAVADAKKVLVGSINWSRQAMRSNRESSVIVESESVAQEFQRVFEEDWAKAKDFVPSSA